MDRDKIPLHNEKFSKQVIEFEKNTEVIERGFFDSSLPIPSHVVLNHINSWENMMPAESVKNIANAEDRATIEGV